MNYTIKQAQLEQFARIYNTLCDISTKGEDTIFMASCLQTMKALVEEVSTQVIQEENKEVKE